MVCFFIEPHNLLQKSQPINREKLIDPNTKLLKSNFADFRKIS